MRNEVDRRQAWAEYVTNLRQAASLSRPALAKRLGVDPATVWRWETGKQKPESPDIPTAIAKLFNVDLDEALAAAGLRPGVEPQAEPTRELDEVELMVRNDPRLSREMQVEIIKMHRERSERDRRAAIEDMRRLIELMLSGGGT